MDDRQPRPCCCWKLDGGAEAGRALDRSRGAVTSPPPAGCDSARLAGGTAGAEAELAREVRGRSSGDALMEPGCCSCGRDTTRGTPPCTLPCRTQQRKLLGRLPVMRVKIQSAWPCCRGSSRHGSNAALALRAVIWQHDLDGG